MSELNAFFLKSESVDVKEEGRCVDEDYVAALELYCLLKQCSLDIRHNWRAVMAVAFASSTYVKYASKSCIKYTRSELASLAHSLRMRNIYRRRHAYALHILADHVTSSIR